MDAGRNDSWKTAPSVLTRSSARARIAGAGAAFAEALAKAPDLREHETGLHSKRAACHTPVLAGRLIDDPEQLRQIYRGALLRDVGKIGAPDVNEKHREQ